MTAKSRCGWKVELALIGLFVLLDRSLTGSRIIISLVFGFQLVFIEKIHTQGFGRPLVGSCGWPSQPLYGHPDGRVE